MQNDELISKNALMQEFDWLNRSYPEDCGNEVAEKLVKLVEKAPAVDAEPVRHERMTNPTFNGVKPVCTGCHIAYDKDPYWNYCPYCGAKMDAEVEG